MATDMIARAMAMSKADLVDGKVPASELPAGYTVDQVYDGTSENAQSGIAIQSVLGNINTVLEEVL